MRMEAGRIGGWQVRDVAAQGALPLVGAARVVVGRPERNSYMEQAVAELHRLPLVGEQRL